MPQYINVSIFPNYYNIIVKSNSEKILSGKILLLLEKFGNTKSCIWNKNYALYNAINLSKMIYVQHSPKLYNKDVCWLSFPTTCGNS